MSCSCRDTLESQFGSKDAQRKLAGFRRRGAPKETKLLIDLLAEADVRDSTVLDVGSGIGAVHGALLERGARSAVSADSSLGFEEAAQELAAERGYVDRVDYRYGDFVDAAPTIEPADVVTLDKVICCYPDADRLLALSAARALRLYGIVHPPDRPLHRFVNAVVNAGRRLLGREFRTYVHSQATIAARMAEAGFRLRSSARTTVWLVEVYER